MKYLYFHQRSQFQGSGHKAQSRRSLDGLCVWRPQTLSRPPSSNSVHPRSHDYSPIIKDRSTIVTSLHENQLSQRCTIYNKWWSHRSVKTWGSNVLKSKRHQPNLIQCVVWRYLAMRADQRLRCVCCSWDRLKAYCEITLTDDEA